MEADRVTASSRSHTDTLCGTVCECGPNREPLACGFKRGHDGPHAWATLPTFDNGGDPVGRCESELAALREEQP